MISLIIFFYGLIFGSFFNVIALRWVKGEGLIEPSHCNKCGVKLRAINLIPIISYIIQKGKCHKCHEKIDLIYPVFEFLTGISFALIYQTYGLSIEFFIQIILISALIISSITDIKEMIVLDRIVIISITNILLLRIIKKELLWIYIFSSISFFIIFYIVSYFGKIGGGDVKLITIIALSVGYYNTLIVLLISSVISIIHVKVTDKKGEIKFVPFIFIGTFLMYFIRYVNSFIL